MRGISPAACHITGAKAAKSGAGPVPVTAPAIRWEAVCVAIVRVG